MSMSRSGHLSKTLDPRDAAAMRNEREAPPEGPLRHAISDAFVGLYKAHFGKGPTKCRTYLEPDLVVVLLRGGFTPAEQTLVESGKWREVRGSRRAWQEVMEAKFRETIEELTGRTVEAFMSESHENPELAIEVFVLTPNGVS
jgi:uncharacterized protein YbcI